MIKVFISIPMNGKTENDIYLERMELLKKLPGSVQDYEILDSWIDEFAPGDTRPGLWYLAKSIEILAHADLVIFAPGWKDARGCVIEEMCAEKYGLARMYV